MYVVITADQRRSRTGRDLVPATLERLAAATRADRGADGGSDVGPDRGAGRAADLARPFERTAGDEVQGVLHDPVAVLGALGVLLRGSAWSVGLGVGPVDLPLPASTRAGRGEAFVLARRAVDQAKRRPGHVAVVATDRAAATHLETVLMLLADLLQRRTPGGWEVADLLDQGLTRAEVADHLGISLSAVSQRVAAAGLVLSERAATLATDLLVPMLAEEGT